MYNHDWTVSVRTSIFRLQFFKRQLFHCFANGTLTSRQPRLEMKTIWIIAAGQIDTANLTCERDIKISWRPALKHQNLLHEMIPYLGAECGINFHPPTSEALAVWRAWWHKTLYHKRAACCVAIRVQNQRLFLIWTLYLKLHVMVMGWSKLGNRPR